MKILKPLASLRLTVILMALSMILIFAGTLAQATHGIWQIVDTYFRGPIAWIDVQIFIPQQLAQTSLKVPFPGGLLIGIALSINLVAAHLIRFKASRKRIGVLVLHAGIIALLLGEFVTAFMSDEGLMSIDEGSSANYVEDVREVEIALIDPSDPTMDRVVAFSESAATNAATSGERLSHSSTPISLQIEKWLPNARLLRSRDQTIANRGVGLEAVADELPHVRGVDGSQADAPAAYITVFSGKEAIGTWLVSASLINAQAVQTGEKTYGIALRYKRTYKPYTLHLIDFRHDRFVGTEIARNFSSLVRVTEPARNTDRQVLISMNNPLRYGGDALYQASYKPDNSGTVLQVVRNPGWLLPYIACTLVTAGMLLHFSMSLVSFLKRDKLPTTTQPVLNADNRRTWHRAVPWVVGIAGFLVAIHGTFKPTDKSEFDIGTFARLPVSAGGRIKPIDTVARNALMIAGGRQSVRTETGRVPATTFLLQLMTTPEQTKDYPIVRVDHPDVLALLNRSPDQGGRLTLAMIEPHWNSIVEQAMRASEVPPKQRDDFQRAIVKLQRRVNRLLSHSQMRSPYAVPPLAPDEEWRPFHEAFLDSHTTMRANPESPPDTPVHPGIASIVNIMTAYHEQDASTFNQAVNDYRHLLQQRLPDAARKASFEVWFNRANLFYGTAIVYVIAFLTVCIALLLRLRSSDNTNTPDNLAEILRKSALVLLVVAAIVHTAAIVFRIYLQERPPVTNLYSSAVFVGWASVLLGIFLERFYRMGIAIAGAAVVGFTTLVIAHNLGSDGDTMQMMQAVLDSNFWLATHVVAITLGYSATFIAGILAIAYLLLGVFTKYLTKQRAKSLTGMVYGVVCFALFLSFLGTVLGGIWADQSWGRFWGWDPKENGAALVVLINAIILHARWGGIIRQRGIMLLAVASNIVTAWSWFGTNMLGVGLHSYGFMDSAVFKLIAFVVIQLGIIAIGLLPENAWRSQQN